MVRHDVVIVGAGQAGLALGYELAQQGRNFVILERADDVAAAWRQRWDSLTLFTPRRYDSLRGLAFPGDPDGYPTRDEVVAYLRTYAAQFDLPLQLGTEATSLSREDGHFVIGTRGGPVVADQVVVATGPFQNPRMPDFAGELPSDVVQMHSIDYHRPSDLPPGRVLVIGGGNTGFQIAEELAPTHEVHLAVGTRQMTLPQRLLGRDAFWWLTKLGLLDKSVETKMGRRASTMETLVGYTPRKLKRLGVRLHGRACAASGRSIRFEDGGWLEPDGVVFATGFTSDYSWIDLPIADERGRVTHRRGVTEVPGLYMLGMKWQWTRGSALIGFVKDDASFIATQLAERAAAIAADAQPEPHQLTNAGQGD